MLVQLLVWWFYRPSRPNCRVEYNGRSSVIAQPTGVHDRKQFCFDWTYTYMIGQGIMDGRESMSDTKVTTDGRRQDLEELMTSGCVSANDVLEQYWYHIYCHKHHLLH